MPYVNVYVYIFSSLIYLYRAQVEAATAIIYKYYHNMYVLIINMLAPPSRYHILSLTQTQYLIPVHTFHAVTMLSVYIQMYSNTSLGL